MTNRQDIHYFIEVALIVKDILLWISFANFAHRELTGDLPDLAYFLSVRLTRYVKTFSCIIRYLVHIHSEATQMRSTVAKNAAAGSATPFHLLPTRA